MSPAHSRPALLSRGHQLWFSNRQIPLLEGGLTHCKQTRPTLSNRQKFEGSDFRVSNFQFEISDRESSRGAVASHTPTGEII